MGTIVRATHYPYNSTASDRSINNLDIDDLYVALGFDIRSSTLDARSSGDLPSYYSIMFMRFDTHRFGKVLIFQGKKNLGHYGSEYYTPVIVDKNTGMFVSSTGTDGRGKFYLFGALGTGNPIYARDWRHYLEVMIQAERMRTIKSNVLYFSSAAYRLFAKDWNFVQWFHSWAILKKGSQYTICHKNDKEHAKEYFATLAEAKLETEIIDGTKKDPNADPGITEEEKEESKKRWNDYYEQQRQGLLALESNLGEIEQQNENDYQEALIKAEEYKRQGKEIIDEQTQQNKEYLIVKVRLAAEKIKIVLDKKINEMNLRYRRHYLKRKAQIFRQTQDKYN